MTVRPFTTPTGTYAITGEHPARPAAAAGPRDGARAAGTQPVPGDVGVAERPHGRVPGARQGFDPATPGRGRRTLPPRGAAPEDPGGRAVRRGAETGRAGAIAD